MVCRRYCCAVALVCHTLCTKHTVVKHNRSVAGDIVCAADKIAVLKVHSACADPDTVLITSYSDTVTDNPVAVKCNRMTALVVLVGACKICALLSCQICKSFKSLYLRCVIFDCKCFINRIGGSGRCAFAANSQIITARKNILRCVIRVSALLRSNADSLFALRYHNGDRVYYVEVLNRNIAGIIVNKERRLINKVADMLVIAADSYAVSLTVTCIIIYNVAFVEALTELIYGKVLFNVRAVCCVIVARPCAGVAPVEQRIVVTVKVAVPCAIACAVIPVQVNLPVCVRSLPQGQILHTHNLNLLLIVAGVYVNRNPVRFRLRIKLLCLCNRVTDCVKCGVVRSCVFVNR